jgi:hypothetical protein
MTVPVRDMSLVDMENCNEITRYSLDRLSQ